MKWSLARIGARLRRSRSGVAVTEFAMTLPLIMVAGLWGLELANFAVVNMRVSQLAIHLADNASRVGDTSALQNRKVFEKDINDLLIGASIQGGKLDLFKHGRTMISSVEMRDNNVNCLPGTGCPGSVKQGDQFIHWQRCKGEKHVAPIYGAQGAVLPNGVGPAGREVMAPSDSAVIFVELHYDYQPLVTHMFIKNSEIKAIAAFLVRDSRDLTGVKQRKPHSPDVVANCNVYDSTF